MPISASTDDFPLGEAQIISTWMGAVAFGAMLVSFFICLRVLFTSESALNPLSFRSLMAVSVLMAILDGLDKSLQLRHMLDAFVYYKGPGGPIEELSETKNGINFAKTVVYVIQTWLGDGVLVYRCMIVYDRRWYGVVPSLMLFVSSLTMGSVMIYVTSAEGHGPITSTKLKPVILSFLLLSLAQNIIITLAIALRIWLLQRSMMHVTFTSTLSRIRRATIIIIESGALYSASMIILVGSFVANHVADYGWSGVASSVIPISFNLIIIRVHQGRAVDQAAAAAIADRPEDQSSPRSRRSIGLSPTQPAISDHFGVTTTALMAKTLVNASEIQGKLSPPAQLAVADEG